MDILFKEIEREKRIKKNANLFILSRKLKHYPLTKKQITYNEFPINLYLGNCYLIKGNTIFRYEVGFSQKNAHISVLYSPILYYGKITVYNMDLSDIGYENADIFIGMDEMITYSHERILNFVHLLFRIGFQLYTH